jgi:hypothetical protein
MEDLYQYRLKEIAKITNSTLTVFSFISVTASLNQTSARVLS